MVCGGMICILRRSEDALINASVLVCFSPTSKPSKCIAIGLAITLEFLPSVAYISGENK